MDSKSPIIAAICSFIFPGLGQLYNGQFGKFCLVILGSVGPFLGAAFMGQIFYFGSGGANLFTVVGVVLFVGSYIYSIVDAYNTAGDQVSEMKWALEKSRQDNEKYIPQAPSEPPPPVPEGGFQRKTRGEADFKPFDPID